MDGHVLVTCACSVIGGEDFIVKYTSASCSYFKDTSFPGLGLAVLEYRYRPSFQTSLEDVGFWNEKATTTGGGGNLLVGSFA